MTVPIQPVRQAPTAPPKQKHISPYYRDYLNDQASAIRARLGDAGIGPVGDTAVRQFLEHDLQRPLGELPAVPLDALENFEPDTPNNLRGVSMALIQGATFGWADEAIGTYLGMATGVGARQGIEDYRAEYAEWAREHGGAAFASEIAGGFLTGGVGGVAKGAAALIGRGAAIGAVAGAGAADAIPTDATPDAIWAATTDRFKSAMIGSTIGVALAGTAVGLGTVVRPIASSIANKVTTSDTFGRVARATANIPVLSRLESATPEGRARELIGNWMKEKSITPAIALKRAQAHWVNGQRASIIDILGDDFKEFARSVFKERSPAAQKVMHMLSERQSAQGDVLIGQLALRTLRNPKLGAANVHTIQRDMEVKASADAAPYYASSHKQVMQITPEMRRIMQKPHVISAWNEQATISNGLLEEGVEQGLRMPTLPTAEEIGARTIKRLKLLKAGHSPADVDAVLPELAFPTELPVRGVDHLKRRMSEAVVERHSKGQRFVTKETQQVIDQELKVIEAQYKSLNLETITQVPDFGKAQMLFSGPMASRDAVQAGFERFMNKASNGHDVLLDMRRIKHPGDRDFYRIGAFKAYYAQLAKSNNPERNVAKDLFSGNLVRPRKGGGVNVRLDNASSRWLALFHDSKALKPVRTQASKDFARLLMGEANFSKTTGRALSLPSQVSTKRVIQEEVGAPGSSVGISAGMTLLRAAQKSLTRDAQQLSKQEVNALTELFGEGLQNPAHLRSLLDDIAHDAKRKVLHVGAKLSGSLLNKAARTVTGAF